MQQGLTIVGLPQFSNCLTFGDLLTLTDQQLPVVPVGTQIFIVMFDDNKLPVANQSTATVNNFSGFGGSHRISGISGHLDSLS